MKKKTITINLPTWKRLMQYKQEFFDETFDDIINRALDKLNGKEAKK